MQEAEQLRRNTIDCGGRVLACGPHDRPLVMGILNVTPDSFSDGGLYMDPGAAVERAARMIEEGADIIDVGGESSRPAGKTYGEGAVAISAAEEADRVVPVIDAIAGAFPDTVISVDTYKSEVARAAVDVGAGMINDITAFRADEDMPSVAAEAGLPVVLMHSVGLPGELRHEHAHPDIVEDVMAGLTAALRVAEEAGIEDVIIDPGFGFGKSVAGNLRIIAELESFKSLGRPILVGISRKSSIGEALEPDGPPRPTDQRLFGSLAAAVVALMHGASIVRTHDVAATRDAVRIVHALRQTTAAREEVEH